MAAKHLEDDVFHRARWVEGREEIAQWLVSYGVPYPAPGQRFRFETKDGVREEGDIEDYARLVHGVNSREHFAARAIELIDRIMRYADAAPWKAIGWAHELGVLDGDARRAGVEPFVLRAAGQIEAGKRGAEAKHGTPEERDARRQKMRSVFEKFRKEQYSKGEAERLAAHHFGCSDRTIRTAVRGK